MIKKLWDEYLLYKKLKHVHEMHMDEGNNISCEMLGKTQNNSGKTETFNHPILNVLHKQLEKGIVFSTDGNKATVTVDAEVGNKLLEIIAAIEEAEKKGK